MSSCATIELMIIWAIAAANGISLALSGVTLYRLSCSIRRFHQRKKLSPAGMLYDLPSVTVCIPARNERHVMTQCLENVLSSNYPKMEVLVCDDSSMDGTSNLIRSFARDGVRFVEGSPLQDDWLGKNNALSDLLQEASGTYVLFMDVDTLIKPDTIGQLVAYAQSAQLGMVSVLPLRRDVLRASVIVAPLRYFWRLVRHSSQHPIAASNLWMIDRKRFKHELGDFTQFKDDPEPEVAIATHFAALHAYRFLISFDLLGVSYEKKLSSQIETAVRLRFPSLGYSFRKTAFAVFGLFTVLMAPVFALLSGVGVVMALGLLVMVTCYMSYALYLSVVWSRGAVIGALLYPFILLLDMWLLLVSATRYTLHTVTWKGRNISRFPLHRR